jgi:hypothetical protein
MKPETYVPLFIVFCTVVQEAKHGRRKRRTRRRRKRKMKTRKRRDELMN